MLKFAIGLLAGAVVVAVAIGLWVVVGYLRGRWRQ